MINWKENYWFNKYYSDKVTPEFEAWWIVNYGLPEAYNDKEEYFIRASFALQGWLAALQRRELIKEI